MASETTPAPVNGNYAPHQNVAEATFPAHTTGSNPPSYTTAQSSSSAQPSSGKGASDIPQDEVGWYFVEQYYTTLSRSPEKLFLFYNKRSQFVSGVEEEKVSVCIGQKAINERIKELDFQDCKVRITNVDSQGSEDHIVIQVIGEISNKHAPHRKFCQTFILAGQTNGYFVLNDIFRYILDEEPELEGEEVQPEPEAPSGYHEPVPTASNAEPKGLTPADDQAAQEADAAKVDKELEEVIKADKASTAIAVPAVPREVNGTPVPEAAEAEEAEDAPAAAVSAPEEAPAAAEPAEEVKEPEKPKEADSKKAAPIPKASPAPPAAPTGPPKVAAPKTWASLAASANRVAMPAVPSAAQSSTASQPKPAPAAPAQAAAPVTAAAAAPAAQTSQQPPREPSPANSGSEGWQTAGHDHSKRQSRTQGQAATGENNSTRAYIKNVYESVDGDVLKKELAKFGEIVYFDISRQKNCAFVDFATLAGFQAAVNANPHTIGENQIYVEERRLRPSGSFPFQRGGGGMPRGRGDRPVGQGRGGFKPEGTRGNFSSRGRGGATTPRGRGSGQAA